MKQSTLEKYLRYQTRSTINITEGPSHSEDEQNKEGLTLSSPHKKISVQHSTSGTNVWTREARREEENLLYQTLNQAERILL